MLIPRISEGVTGDVLAGAVEHGDERVALARALVDPAAEVRASFERAGDGHQAFRTDGDATRALIGTVSEALAPAVLTSRVEGGDEDVAAARVDECATAQVEGSAP